MTPAHSRRTGYSRLWCRVWPPSEVRCDFSGYVTSSELQPVHSALPSLRAGCSPWSALSWFNSSILVSQTSGFLPSLRFFFPSHWVERMLRVWRAHTLQEGVLWCERTAACLSSSNVAAGHQAVTRPWPDRVSVLEIVIFFKCPLLHAFLFFIHPLTILVLVTRL